MKVEVIGAGLAGCEATYYLAEHGVEVTLYDIKPRSFTPEILQESLSVVNGPVATMHHDLGTVSTPVEVMASRGFESLRFANFKPVGLKDKDGNRFYAVLQLRKENADGTAYNLVGCQTNLKWGEQKG